MNLFFILIGIILIIYIMYAVINKKFALYESIFWIFATIVIIILAIFPKSLDTIAFRLGVSYPPSLVFLLAITFLLFINFRQTRMINDITQKLNDTTQELSILRAKVSEINKKEDETKNAE